MEGAHRVCALEVFEKLKNTTVLLCEQTKQAAEFVHCTECLYHSPYVMHSSIYIGKAIGWFSSWKHIMPELIPQKILILGNEELYCNPVILYFHTVKKSCGSQSKTISWLWFQSVIWSPSLTWEVFKRSLIKSALFTYFSCLMAVLSYLLLHFYFHCFTLGFWLLLFLSLFLSLACL